MRTHSKVGLAVSIQIPYSEGNTEATARPRDSNIGGGSGGRDGAVVVEEVGAAGIGGISMGTHREVGLAVSIQITHGKGSSKVVSRGFTRDGDIGGGSGGGDGAVVVEDIRAAGIGGISFGSDDEIGFPVGIEIAGGEGDTKVIIGRFTGDNDIRGGSGGRDGTVVVEDIRAAGVGGISMGTHREVGFPVGIEIAGGERDTEVIIGRFTGDGDIGGGSRGRDGAVVVEDIRAAGIGGISMGTHREVGLAIGVQIASGEGDTKIIPCGFTGDDDIGGGSGGGDGAVVVEDIRAAGIGGISMGTHREVGLAIGVQIACSECDTEIIIRRFTGNNHICT